MQMPTNHIHFKQNKEKYIDAMKSSNMTDAVSTIVNLIEETVN